MKKYLAHFFLLMLVVELLVCSTAQAQYKCLEGDCFNGKGKKVLEDGSGSLEGEFWRGALVSGKVEFPNGDVFEGQFQETDLIRGVKRFKNGTMHEGKFHGTVLVEGKITYPDGTSHDVHMKTYREPVPTAKKTIPLIPPIPPQKPAQ